MLNINHLARMRSIAFLPCKIVLEDLIQPPSKKSCYHQGFFAVKRRAVFILGTMWIALVRGWRSIPRCPKAVFYVFVFDSIHNSATLHNLSPGIFHRSAATTTPSRRDMPSACFNGNTASKHSKGMLPQSAGNLLEAVEGVGEDCAAEKGEDDGHLVA